jgi:RNA polymerase sigma factor (sigma-70 family)
MSGSFHPLSGTAGRRPASSSLSLVRRAKEGDSRATDELCDRYLPRLRRWAHGRLPGWARGYLDTEDLVQDTLIRSVRQIDHLAIDHDYAFHAYLRQALQNRLRDAVRQAQRKPAGAPLLDNERSAEPSPLDLAVGSETLQRYEEALARLSPSDRELLIAKIEMNLSYPEMAEVLERPSQGALRVAVSRALVRLAREMRRDRQAS